MTWVKAYLKKKNKILFLNAFFTFYLYSDGYPKCNSKKDKRYQNPVSETTHCINVN